MLDPAELLVAVRLPVWPATRRWGFEEFSRRKGDFALAGVALHFDRDANGAVAAPHIVGLGITDRPVRLAGAEEAIRGKKIDEESLAAAVRAAAVGIDISADIHAPADYRAALLGTLLERALRRAADLGEAA